MIVEARLTRTGVFTYRNADGSMRREYRPPTEVHRADSRATFRGVPVTNDHPPSMLTAKNARQFAVGAVLETPRQDGDWLVAALSIFDAKAISDLDSGKRQVSCGYDCELLQTPGVTPEGERYDAIQQDIIGNHLAIVADARAGAGAHVRMDDAAIMLGTEDATCAPARDMQSSCLQPTTTKVQSMPNEKSEKQDEAQSALRSLEAQRSDAEQRATAAVADAAAQKLRADTAEGKLIELQKQLDEALAKNTEASQAFETEVLAKEKQRADAAEDQVKQFDARFDAAVKSRVSLERRAAVVLGPEFRMDDLSDRQIMASVVSKLDSTADVSDKIDDGIIKGRFLAITERHASTARDLARVAEITAAQPHRDSKAERDQKQRDAWMQPLPTNRYKSA